MRQEHLWDLEPVLHPEFQESQDYTVETLFLITIPTKEIMIYAGVSEVDGAVVVFWERQ